MGGDQKNDMSKRPNMIPCEAGLVLGPAGSRPALYASLCLLFGRIPGNSAPGTTNLRNSSHSKLGGRKAHTSLSSADMHTVSCRFSLCSVELPASCAGAAVRAPASQFFSARSAKNPTPNPPKISPPDRLKAENSTPNPPKISPTGVKI